MRAGGPEVSAISMRQSPSCESRSLCRNLNEDQPRRTSSEGSSGYGRLNSEFSPFRLPAREPGRGPEWITRTAKKRLWSGRVQARDEMAFREIVERYQSKVFSIIYGILRNRNDAEDIAQQVFAKIYFSIKNFDFHRRRDHAERHREDEGADGDRRDRWSRWAASGRRRIAGIRHATRCYRGTACLAVSRRFRRRSAIMAARNCGGGSCKARCRTFR